MSELQNLARQIYEITKRDVWLGGKIQTRNKPGPKWPKGLEKIDWYRGLTWTLSPEIELGGIRLRVCVSWDGTTSEFGPGTHGVRVFADDELKYPGGFYSGENRKGFFVVHRDAWSWNIVQLERADGGRTGRVQARDQLLKEARKMRMQPKLHIDEPEPSARYCENCETLIAQIEYRHEVRVVA